MLWTAPTKEGDAALNAFHPLAPAKRLRAKPLRKFEDSDLFLRVQQAEKEGLVSWGLGGEDGLLQGVVSVLCTPCRTHVSPDLQCFWGACLPSAAHAHAADQ